jgi:hypothetical protein
MAKIEDSSFLKRWIDFLDHFSPMYICKFVNALTAHSLSTRLPYPGQKDDCNVQWSSQFRSRSWRFGCFEHEGYEPNFCRGGTLLDLARWNFLSFMSHPIHSQSIMF